MRKRVRAHKITTKEGFVIRTSKSGVVPYLWFGNKDGKEFGMIYKASELRKLRRFIDRILGESEGEI